MSHGGKLSMLETMGQPRLQALLGEKVAESATAPTAQVASTLEDVEAMRDQMAGEVQADQAAYAEANALRRNAVVLGPLAWARGGPHLTRSLDANVTERAVELDVTVRAHASLTSASAKLRAALEGRAKGADNDK